MFDILLTEEEKKLKQEVKRFVKEKVPSSLIRAMDADEVKYPKEFIESLAAHNLLGLRFSKEWGGRGMKWTGEVAAIEEIGVLGSGMSCLYSLVSIVGEAIHHFGTPEQKAKYLKPTLEGKLCCAEALTEPRGGSDFFGPQPSQRRMGTIIISMDRSVSWWVQRGQTISWSMQNQRRRLNPTGPSPVLSSNGRWVWRLSMSMDSWAPGEEGQAVSTSTIPKCLQKMLWVQKMEVR